MRCFSTFVVINGGFDKTLFTEGIWFWLTAPVAPLQQSCRCATSRQDKTGDEKTKRDLFQIFYPLPMIKVYS